MKGRKEKEKEKAAGGMGESIPANKFLITALKVWSITLNVSSLPASRDLYSTTGRPIVLQVKLNTAVQVSYCCSGSQ